MFYQSGFRGEARKIFNDLRRDGSWRKVRVKVGGRHRARTQSGYYDRPRTLRVGAETPPR